MVEIEKVICPHNSPSNIKGEAIDNETTVYHSLPPQWDLGGRKTSCMACQQKKFEVLCQC